ncbi:MAG TPA: glycosyltransferase [Candidatus Angelobacter sp.]|nr:glycosyltransferase [Candidatus Angelobacter sp.]
MRVLYVSYPLLTVSDESAGGAEQVLWTLEREMVRRGVSSTVAASRGSCVSGDLLDTGEPCSAADDLERRNKEHQARILDFIGSEGGSLDLIHDKSGSFWMRAAEIDLPVLATLHLPRHFYDQSLFHGIPPNVTFNCVSSHQTGSFSDLRSDLGSSLTTIPNGIPLDRFQPNGACRNGLLWLGRICEEKGTHLALEIASLASSHIVLAGQVYPFSYHRQYFEREVAPRLQNLQSTASANFIERPSAAQKRKLLSEASALLITSLVDETSSLVAMEAAASGTPVIAFRRGALPEVVKDGVTGFLVEDVEEAAVAVTMIWEISPDDCRRHAEENFSSGKMAERYAELYSTLKSRCSQS